MSLPLRFARYRDIAIEVAERLAASRGSDALRPWDEDVIVPSAGLAEGIARELGGVAALELLRIEELARRILNDAGEFPRVASEGERRLAMRTAVRSVDDPMMTTRGIASMLERSYRDVRDGGLSLDELRTRVNASRGLRNVARTRLILRAWSEYERLIAQLAAIDPAELFTRAAALVARDAKLKPQLLAGFYDMTGVQFRLVEAIRDAGKLAAVWIPVDSSEAYRFATPFVQKLTVSSRAERSGVEGPPAMHDEPRAPEGGPSTALGMTPDTLLRIRTPRTEVVVHDTRIAELQSITDAIRALLDDGVHPRAIAVVGRSVDPYDARLFHRFAVERNFTTTLAEEIPLTAHRLGRGIVTLLRLRERGFPRHEVLELVRDGLKVKTRIDVDKADEETRRSRVAGGTSDELRAVKRRTRSVEDYIALVAELEQLTATIDLDRLPGMFRLETQQDLAAAERIDDIAELFRRTRVWNRPVDIPSIVDALESETLPQPGVRDLPRIWFGDVMKFRGRAFEHVFAMRMQDDVFPQRRNEDPLLPDPDRRLLGIREIGNGRDEEQLLLQLLIDGANASARFSYAASDGFGKILRGSRLLREVAESRGSEVPGATTKPRNPEPPQPRKRQLQLLTRAGTRSVFDGYLLPALIHDRVLRALQSVSPTQLEDFGECPQKFLFKHLLGVYDIDDPEREVQIHHREKGTLDHRILERFYRDLDAETIATAAAALPRLDEALGTRLESFIDVAFDEFEEEYPPFNRAVRDIERRATKRILRNFLVADLGELAAAGLMPRHFEYRFGPKYAERGNVAHPESFTVEAEGVTIRVDGSIDRIDSDGENYRIVDYKSGKALRHKELAKKIDRGVRMQLALYAMAVARFFGVEASKVAGAIKPLVVSADIKATTFAFALAEKEGALVETIALFIRSMLAGQFPAFPNERDDDFNSCKYCPVNHSCRTKHDVDERYAVQAHRDPRTLLSESR